MTTETMTVDFVEAPARQLVKLPINLIKDIPAPTSKARQLSLTELGQVDPIRVRPTEDGLYEITDGRRRVANLIAAGAIQVECIVEQVDDARAALQSLALNVSRSHSPMVEARLIAQLVQVGQTQQEIARSLGVTQGFIAQRLGLLDLVPELQERLELSQMTMSAARSTKKLPVQDQLELAQMPRITVDAAEAMLRGYQAEMVDLSQIDIPAMPVKPDVIELSQDQMSQLQDGGEIEVSLGSRVVRIKARL